VGGVSQQLPLLASSESVGGADKCHPGQETKLWNKTTTEVRFTSSLEAPSDTPGDLPHWSIENSLVLRRCDLYEDASRIRQGQAHQKTWGYCVV